MTFKDIACILLLLPWTTNSQNATVNSLYSCSHRYSASLKIFQGFKTCESSTSYKSGYTENSSTNCLEIARVVLNKPLVFHSLNIKYSGIFPILIFVVDGSDNYNVPIHLIVPNKDLSVTYHFSGYFLAEEIEIRFTPNKTLPSNLTIFACSSCDLEVTGCPMGMKTGMIPNFAITASSSFVGYSPANVRLDHQISTKGSSIEFPAWCAALEDPSPYVQVDVGDIFILKSLEFQSSDFIKKTYITKFFLTYSLEGSQWSCYADCKNITLHYDVMIQYAQHIFSESDIMLRYIRIHISGWETSRACMRFEISGHIPIQNDHRTYSKLDFKILELSGKRLFSFTIGNFHRHFKIELPNLWKISKIKLEVECKNVSILLSPYDFISSDVISHYVQYHSFQTIDKNVKTISLYPRIISQIVFISFELHCVPQAFPAKLQMFSEGSMLDSFISVRFETVSPGKFVETSSNYIYQTVKTQHKTPVESFRCDVSGKLEKDVFISVTATLDVGIEDMNATLETQSLHTTINSTFGQSLRVSAATLLNLGSCVKAKICKYRLACVVALDPRSMHKIARYLNAYVYPALTFKVEKSAVYNMNYMSVLFVRSPYTESKMMNDMKLRVLTGKVDGKDSFLQFRSPELREYFPQKVDSCSSPQHYCLTHNELLLVQSGQDNLVSQIEKVKIGLTLATLKLPPLIPNRNNSSYHHRLVLLKSATTLSSDEIHLHYFLYGMCSGFHETFAISPSFPIFNQSKIWENYFINTDSLSEYCLYVEFNEHALVNSTGCFLLSWNLFAHPSYKSKDIRMHLSVMQKTSWIHDTSMKIIFFRTILIDERNATICADHYSNFFTFQFYANIQLEHLNSLIKYSTTAEIGISNTENIQNSISNIRVTRNSLQYLFKFLHVSDRKSLASLSEFMPPVPNYSEIILVVIFLEAISKHLIRNLSASIAVESLDHISVILNKLTVTSRIDWQIANTLANVKDKLSLVLELFEESLIALQKDIPHFMSQRTISFGVFFISNSKNIQIKEFKMYFVSGVNKTKEIGTILVDSNSVDLSQTRNISMMYFQDIFNLHTQPQEFCDYGVSLTIIHDVIVVLKSPIIISTHAANDSIIISLQLNTLNHVSGPHRDSFQNVSCIGIIDLIEYGLSPVSSSCESEYKPRLNQVTCFCQSSTKYISVLDSSLRVGKKSCAVLHSTVGGVAIHTCSVLIVAMTMIWIIQYPTHFSLRSAVSSRNYSLRHFSTIRSVIGLNIQVIVVSLQSIQNLDITEAFFVWPIFLEISDNLFDIIEKAPSSTISWKVRCCNVGSYFMTLALAVLYVFLADTVMKSVGDLFGVNADTHRYFQIGMFIRVSAVVLTILLLLSVHFLERKMTEDVLRQPLFSYTKDRRKKERMYHLILSCYFVIIWCLYLMYERCPTISLQMTFYSILIMVQVAILLWFFMLKSSMNYPLSSKSRFLFPLLCFKLSEHEYIRDEDPTIKIPSHWTNATALDDFHNKLDDSCQMSLNSFQHSGIPPHADQCQGLDNSIAKNLYFHDDSSFCISPRRYKFTEASPLIPFESYQDLFTSPLCNSRLLKKKRRT